MSKDKDKYTAAEYRLMLGESNKKEKKKHHTSHISKGWKTVGGQRFYSKSNYEYLFAKYLEYQKKKGEILDWRYEPKTFWFEGIKRGTNNYKPDFCVKKLDGTFEFYEVKGYLDSKSKTKLKRMKKYHPKVKLHYRGGEWFKENGAGLKLLPD